MSKVAEKPRWGSDSNIETLAAIVSHDRRNGNMSPGVAFARAHNTHKIQWREKKDLARSYVCSLFGRENWPDSLSIVTMPGVLWRTEKALLRHREYDKRPALDGPLLPFRTVITAIEREPPIFTAALKDMPGAAMCLEHLPGDLPKTHYTMRTPVINRFHLTSFEDFAEVNTKTYGGAWLDFTGPLTGRLYEALPHFWSYTRRTLVVTMLNARWDRELSNKVSAAGGVEHVLHKRLRGATLAHIYRYNDTVPMIQLTFERVNPAKGEESEA